MKSQEFTGKTVKDAINKGLAELGCDSADVEIQVLEMGSPGLFGMFGRPAKVRLTTKDKSDDLDIEMPVFSLEQPSGKPARQRRERPAKPEREPKPEPVEKIKVEKPKPVEKPAQAAEAEDVQDERPEPIAGAEDGAEATVDKPRRRRSRSRREHAANRPEAAAEAEPVVEPEPIVDEPFVPTPEEELSDDAKRARDFLKGLTERMNVPAEIAVADGAEQVRMVLSGENMSILIGRRGETLDALQYLTSLNVNRTREDYLRVSLDTENYRARREEALRKLAIRMANRCRKSGRRVAMEPMNPYERRILHSALQNDPDVTTHSEGEEPHRRVIITMK